MVGRYVAAVKSLWKGRCDVYVRKTEVSKANGRNEPAETCILCGVPCRLSFCTVSAASDNGEADLVKQTVKLFLDREIVIPEGSKITVSQNGVTANYYRSGKPAVYSTHQEIMLEHFEEWA